MTFSFTGGSTSTAYADITARARAPQLPFDAAADARLAGPDGGFTNTCVHRKHHPFNSRGLRGLRRAWPSGRKGSSYERTSDQPGRDVPQRGSLICAERRRLPGTANSTSPSWRRSRRPPPPSRLRAAVDRRTAEDPERARRRWTLMSACSGTRARFQRYILDEDAGDQARAPTRRGAPRPGNGDIRPDQTSMGAQQKNWALPVTASFCDRQGSAALGRSNEHHRQEPQPRCHRRGRDLQGASAPRADAEARRRSLELLL